MASPVPLPCPGLAPTSDSACTLPYLFRVYYTLTLRTPRYYNLILQPDYNRLPCTKIQVFYDFLQKIYIYRYGQSETRGWNQPRGATRCFTLFTGCAFAQNPSLEDQLDRAPLTLEVGKSPSDRYATAS